LLANLKLSSPDARAGIVRCSDASASGSALFSLLHNVVCVLTLTLALRAYACASLNMSRRHWQRKSCQSHTGSVLNGKCQPERTSTDVQEQHSLPCCPRQSNAFHAGQGCTASLFCMLLGIAHSFCLIGCISVAALLSEQFLAESHSSISS